MGMLRLAAATPRTAAAWTSSGTSHEQRGLKHRPDGAIRMVPVPPVLVAMLRAHVTAYGTAPDGRLFRGTRGGPLSESSYGRTWHTARTQALGPAAAATTLARRPYDLRHAALSLWLNAALNRSSATSTRKRPLAPDTMVSGGTGHGGGHPKARWQSNGAK
jgi:integrase